MAVFYDAKTLHPFRNGVHKRYSAGGTIITARGGVFFNTYKRIKDSIEGYKTSAGYDLGLNSMLPRYENISLRITKYSLNEEKSRSKFKIKYTPNSLFTFGMETNNENGLSVTENSICIETTYKFNTNFEDQ